MIEIVPYQPRWPREFQELSEAIRRALGDRILSVDHIGSTSVPGLAAKDIIDVQLTVRDLEVEIRESLESLGFDLGTPSRDHAPPGLVLDSADLDDVKDPACDLIMSGAYLWAEISNWQPTPR